MPRYTKEREEQIRALLSQLESSGRPVREFAAEHGVSAWTVYSWRKRFERPQRARSMPKADLIELSPRVAHTATIEITVADASVRVSPGFEDDDLARVLRAVRSC